MSFMKQQKRFEEQYCIEIISKISNKFSPPSLNFWRMIVRGVLFSDKSEINNGYLHM